MWTAGWGRPRQRVEKDDIMTTQLRQEANGQRITAAALRRSPFFRDVPESALASLAAVSVRQDLDHGALLWQPGDAIETVLVLAAGVVRLYREGDNSEEVAVALLDRRQVCGLAGLDAAFTPTTVAQALVDETVVYRIPRRDFAAFLRANPAVVLRALDATCQRVRDAYDLCAAPDLRGRVAYVLAHLAAVNGERTVWVTHEELALWAHGRREAISGYVLPELRERGLIAYERHRRGIRVRDRAGLLALSTHDM
jgi:CRP-like cAMP-binding protein